MIEEGARRALGRGLAALIGEVEPERASERSAASRKVAVDLLAPNPRNPRKDFEPAALEDLAASVREKGIVQPILVRPDPNRTGRFEIIAGERRWRAAQRAGLHEVPILVRDASDKEALELAIVENVQRADLNALEEAGGYEQLIAEFGYTQAELAETIGKSRPHVANTLRLLRLPESVKAYVRDGRLTAGHARAIVGADDPNAVARRIVEAGLTVRDAEALSARPSTRKPRAAPVKDADTLALEKSLSDLLGLTVAIDHRAGGSGELKVRYRSLEQLDEVCRRLRSA